MHSMAAGVKGPVSDEITAIGKRGGRASDRESLAGNRLVLCRGSRRARVLVPSGTGTCSGPLGSIIGPPPVGSRLRAGGQEPAFRVSLMKEQ